MRSRIIYEGRMGTSWLWNQIDYLVRLQRKRFSLSRARLIITLIQEGRERAAREAEA